MKTRTIAVLFVAALLCGCANSKKKENADAAGNTTMKWVNASNRDERMQLWDKMQAQRNADDGKPFNGTSTAKVREFRTGTYEGGKEAPQKTFYTKTKEGVGSYGGMDKKAYTREAVLSQQSALAGTNQTYISKDYNANQTYAGANAAPNVPKGAVPTRTTAVPGAASKDTLTAEGQALNQKVQKGELTIEQVREILNKNR